MSQVIECRAPGKVILHGEYAVVYGKNAIAVTVDLETKVSIKLISGGNNLSLKLDNYKVCQVWPINQFKNIRLMEEKAKLNEVIELNDQLIKKVNTFYDSSSLSKDVINSLNAFLLLYIALSDSYNSSNRQSIEVIVSSSLPCGAGLGSSSSYTVSLTAALMKVNQMSPDLKLINEWAFQMDKIFHGRPSGIDNSICTYGGALLFRSGQIQEQTQTFQPIPVILVNTKVPRNTKVMVEKAQKKYKEFPKIMENIYLAIDEISVNGWQLINKSDNLQAFGSLFDMNHHLLNCVGAGHPAIDRVISCANKYGLSAKLTGAGGGGTVIILNNADKNITEQLYKDLIQCGFEYWSVSLGCSGVSLK